MTTIKYQDLLFAACSGENIDLTGRPGKATNTLGIAGVGLSTSRPASAKTRPAKYSTVARGLDHILLYKNTIAMEATDSIYGQTTIDGKIYRYQCDGTSVKFEGERLHGSAKIVPFIIFHMRSKSSYEEFKNAVYSIKDDAISSGIAATADILLVCDSFWYSIAKDSSEITFAESELAMETVQKQIDSGGLAPMKLFDGMKTPEMTGVNATKKAVKRTTSKKVDVFSDILAGKYVIPYGWSENQATRIPTLSSLEDYVPNKEFYHLVSKIHYRFNKIILRMNAGLDGVDAIQKDYVNTFLLGRPGTGKTKTLYAVAAALGLPIYTIPLSKNSEEDIFQGMNKVIDGELKFVSTDFLEAITSGGIIALEEINLADPGVVMGSIGQTIEYPFCLLRDGYITEKRHPLAAVFGLFNIGTYGSKGINQALSNRFKQSIVLDEVKKEDFINILKKQLNSTNCTVDESAFKFSMPIPRELGDEDVSRVYEVYNRITSYLKSPKVNADEEALNISIRTCTGTLECMEEGESFKDAVYHTLIGKIAESDLELAQSVFADVVGSMPD